MHVSTLIISSNDTQSRDEVIQICKNEKIEQFDITFLEKKEDSASIGIKDVKEILQKIYLKPLKSPSKAIIIPNAELLTTEAQNSLLKILEEPPENTIIILLSTSLDRILPTIQSRCKVIQLSPNDTTEPDSASLESFTSLKTLSTKNALELADQLSKNKEEASLKIKELILAGKKILLQEILTKSNEQLLTARIIKDLTLTHKNLTNTNINTRLELENLFLTLTTDK